VTVGEYGSDPDGAPTFNKCSGSNDFFDVSVSSGSTFQTLVFTICGLDGNADAMSWWDATTAGANGTWAPLAPASSVVSLKPGCLTATITGRTSPAATDLGGTVFGVALRLATQRVRFTTAGPSRAVAGDSYRPVAVATSKLPVAYSIDPSSAKGACSVTANGTVNFTGAGICLLDATQAGDARWAAVSLKRDITVLAGKPVAEDASYSTPIGRALRVAARDGVLARDSVNDATIFGHTSPAHGSLMLLGNGAFTYVPKPSFSGTDHFTYTLRNSLGRSTATISIEVGDLTRGRRAEGKRA
jgi:Bacterial Ig domain